MPAAMPVVAAVGALVVVFALTINARPAQGPGRRASTRVLVLALVPAAYRCYVAVHRLWP